MVAASYKLGVPIALPGRGAPRFRVFFKVFRTTTTIYSVSSPAEGATMQAALCRST